jgi:hypothetical protein
MFVTPNELAAKYQLWSLLSGKCHLESSALVRNGLPNSNFSGTSRVMKIGSFGLSPSFFNHKLYHLLHMNQFEIRWDMTLPVVLV